MIIGNHKMTSCFLKPTSGIFVSNDPYKAKIVPIDWKYRQAVNGIIYDCVPANYIQLEQIGQDWPDILHVPLEKTAEPTNHIATASGQRSAILTYNGTQYRLKGCGEFYTQPVTVFGETIGQQIRGCSFTESSDRELYMTQYIYDIVSKDISHFRMGNIPIGKWIYANGTTCTLMETLGDRRLYADMIAEIDKMVDAGIIVAQDNQFLDKLTKNIPSWKKVNTNEILVNLLEYPDLLNIDMDLLAKCYQVGSEAGEFLGSIHKHDILWGYFYDHNPCLPHCNSHPNNFVLLEKEQRLLAPVDFDMSFCKRDFVSPYTFEKDDALFEEWKKCEFFEMARALGGDTANTGISTEHEIKCFNNIKIAIHDTILAGFFESYYILC